MKYPDDRNWPCAIDCARRCPHLRLCGLLYLDSLSEEEEFS
jgi:hypothetical protein